MLQLQLRDFADELSYQKGYHQEGHWPSGSSEDQIWHFVQAWVELMQQNDNDATMLYISAFKQEQDQSSKKNTLFKNSCRASASSPGM